jgi:DDE superfamily endonuclease
MEDVLAVYTRPYDARYPQICFDEIAKQLLADLTPPAPMEPGRPQREDYEYERHGVRNLFLWYEPLTSRRHVEVTDHRTRLDFAHQMQQLVDVHYPDAIKIILVVDNLNIHSPASLYAAFAPAEAKRISDRLEFHYTPKHGSWLDMAEIELAILSAQCLDRRIPDEETLKAEVAAWEEARNATATKVNWRFTTPDARIKLRHLYPSHDG